MTREFKLQVESRPPCTIDFHGQLDPQQIAAVTCPFGPTLVIAGAGSGKTRTITYRVAHLISSGVSPDRILLLTFTNKAANVMIQRIQELIPLDSRKMWAGTFHSTGNRLLRRHATTLGYRKNFTILDQEDANDLISAAIDVVQVHVGDGRLPQPTQVRDIISTSLNTGASLQELLQHQYPEYQKLGGWISAVTEGYAKRKLSSNCMDFDDLLVNWLRLLTEHPESREQLLSQFEHILVDEYQDTNLLQAHIVDEMASHHRNLVAVGDDAQGIYGWRGANFDNMFKFPERYPDASLLTIETNYRSTPEILAIANHSIKNNKQQLDKTLVAQRKGCGVLPALVPLSDLDQQANFVAARILELRDEAMPLSGIAVLYRSHRSSLELEMELIRRNIPYEVRSGLKFFERSHIKDVVSYLRLAANPKDEVAWKRVLKMLPGVGKVTANQLWGQLSYSTDQVLIIRYAKTGRGTSGKSLSALADLLESIQGSRNGSPASQIELIVASRYRDYLVSKYDNAQDRIEDLNQLANYAAKFDSTESFLTDIVLVAAEDSKRKKGLTGVDSTASDADESPVVLSTIHKAKGLEWKAVFVIGLNEGNFPSPRSLNTTDQEEEERRLFYVAVTRAEDQLYLCYPLRERDYSGQDVLHKPSRFITEVPGELLEKWQVSR